MVVTLKCTFCTRNKPGLETKSKMTISNEKIVFIRLTLSTVFSIRLFFGWLWLWRFRVVPKRRRRRTTFVPTSGPWCPRTRSRSRVGIATWAREIETKGSRSEILNYNVLNLFLLLDFYCVFGGWGSLIKVVHKKILNLGSSKIKVLVA
jgi:hypothetical protein